VLERFIESQLALQGPPPALGEDDRASRAVALLEEAIGLDPKQPVLWRYLAQAWASEPDPQRAARAARRAVELDEGNAQSHYVLGLALQSSGSYAEAEEHFLVALKYGLGSGSEYLPRYYLYEVRRQRGDTDGALQALHDWRAALPESATPIVLAARFLWNAGRGAEAEQTAAEALRADPRSEDSLAVLLAATELDPLVAVEAMELALRSDWSANSLHKELVSLYEAMGRYDLALEHLMAFRTLSSYGASAFLNDEARLQLSMFRLDEADALMEDSIAAGREVNGSLIRQLARSYLVRGDSEGGISRLRELRLLFPGQEVHIDREISALQGEALPVEINPPGPEPATPERVQGVIDDLRPKWDEEPLPSSAKQYQQRMRTELERVNLQLRLSFAQRSAGDRLGCEATLLDVLARHPRLAYALNALAYLWAEDGRRLPEALRLQQRALEQQPYSGAFQDTIAWVHFRMGNLDEALSSLELAVRYLPGNPEILEHLGDVLRAMGMRAPALERYREAYESLPSVGLDGLRERLSSKSQRL